MLLTISKSSDFIKKMDNLYLSSGMLSLFLNTNILSDFVEYETDADVFVVVDPTVSAKELRSVIEHFRSLHQDSYICVFGKAATISEAIYEARSVDELLDFLSPLIKQISSNLNLKMLTINPFNRSALLLGYPIKLTPSEYRILVLLSSDPNRVFTNEEILALAFPLKSSVNKNQIAVHVCNLNKKARLISERPLILNPHKNGYVLNPHL